MNFTVAADTDRLVIASDNFCPAELACWKPDGKIFGFAVVDLRIDFTHKFDLKIKNWSALNGLNMLCQQARIRISRRSLPITLPGSLIRIQNQIVRNLQNIVFDRQLLVRQLVVFQTHCILWVIFDFGFLSLVFLFSDSLFLWLLEHLICQLFQPFVGLLLHGEEVPLGLALLHFGSGIFGRLVSRLWLLGNAGCQFLPKLNKVHLFNYISV